MSETIPVSNRTVLVLNRNVPISNKTVAVSDQTAPVPNRNDVGANQIFPILGKTVAKLSKKFSVEIKISGVDKDIALTWSCPDD